MEDLSAAIRAIRQSLGMRQADLAVELGVKRNTVSQYETGDATPSLAVLVRLYNLVPPGDLRNGLEEYMVRDLKSNHSVQPERGDLVFKSLLNTEALLAQFPRTPSTRRGLQLERLASVVSHIAGMPMLDDSIIDILKDWLMHGGSETVKVFRDAAEYLHLRLDILVGVDTDESIHADLMLQNAKAARRLAIALLRQADIAEEKASTVRKRKRTKKELPDFTSSGDHANMAKEK
jgi:transcriptional regulator with XRE-family HTH domain